jgi:hypothetical protein
MGQEMAGAVKASTLAVAAEVPVGRTPDVTKRTLMIASLSL